MSSKQRIINPYPLNGENDMEKTIPIDKEKLNSRIEEAKLFSKRFGSFSKSDYEVLMFTVYLDSLTNTAQVYDFEISKDLGITEQKVRNLRVKSQLMYPREINWVDQIRQAIEYGTYHDGMITITLEDPYVRNLIKYKVESKSVSVYLSLNNKQLILPLKNLLNIAACAEDNTDEVICAMNEYLKSNKDIKKNKTGDIILEGANIAQILQGVMTLYTFGKPIIEAVIKLLGNN